MQNAFLEYLRNEETAQYLYQAAIDSNTSIKLEPNIALFYHTCGQIKYALGDFCANRGLCEINPNYTEVLTDL